MTGGISDIWKRTAVVVRAGIGRMFMTHLAYAALGVILFAPAVGILSRLLLRAMHVLPYGSTVVAISARTTELLLLALLLGIAWTLRQTLPRYVHQIQIFLLMVSKFSTTNYHHDLYMYQYGTKIIHCSISINMRIFVSNALCNRRH